MFDKYPVLRLFSLTSLLAVSLFNAGCVYKIDVQQGNIVSQEMLDQLRPNMTKQQVRFIMGTPLLESVFDQQRWDYYYSYEPGSVKHPRHDTAQQRKITVVFEQDSLREVTGDVSVNLQRPPDAMPDVRSEEPLL